MCAVLSCSVMSNSLWPHGCSLPSSSVHDVSPGKNTGVGCHASSRESSQPRIESRSPTLQVGSLPSEPPGKPKNVGVCSLSLLQESFLTQELNQCLLHRLALLYFPTNWWIFSSWKKSDYSRILYNVEDILHDKTGNSGLISSSWQVYCSNGRGRNSEKASNWL